MIITFSSLILEVGRKPCGTMCVLYYKILLSYLLNSADTIVKTVHDILHYTTQEYNVTIPQKGIQFSYKNFVDHY